MAAAQRRLEVRIGELLGPAKLDHDRTAGATSLTNDLVGLSPNQRSEFRRMAEDPETVEDVIAASTDVAPASRRKVTEAIKATKPEPAKPHWRVTRFGLDLLERLREVGVATRVPASLARSQLARSTAASACVQAQSGER